MKMKTFQKLCAATVALTVFTGCQGFDKKFDKAMDKITIQRSVENNIFMSSFPEIKLKIQPELKYLGDAQFTQSTNKRTKMQNINEDVFEEHSYLFGQVESKKLIKGVLIRTMVMRGNPNKEVKDQFFIMDTILESGSMKILDEDYQYNLYTQQDLFTDEEKALLDKSSIPACSLVKQLEGKAGIGNKSRVQIFYFEDISTVKGLACKEPIEIKSLAGEQKQFVQAFTDRSYQSIRFLKTMTDTTSKYVDADATGSDSVKAPARPDDGASKAQTIESKLKTLKDLHDKNLITDDEFNKKKAEILKDL